MLICMQRNTQEFNECCFDAMDYDDNFDISSVSSHGNQKSDKGVSSKDSESMVPSVKDVNQDEIAEMVLKRLGQLRPPPYRPTYVPQVHRRRKALIDAVLVREIIERSNVLHFNLWEEIRQLYGVMLASGIKHMSQKTATI